MPQLSERQSSSWPPGAATAAGSLPGTDPAEAIRLVFGELPELPFLPELPARGPGADMLGRSSALLVSMPVEIVPSGWRLADHPGRDLRRANDFLEHDLDTLTELAGEYQGALKLQVAGPWTLAAGIELPTGHKAVSDPGAARDIAESLAEGIRQHLAAVQARVPGARLVLQIDEPSLPAVLAGQVATASGYGSVAAVEQAVAQPALATVLRQPLAAATVVHCCHPAVPIGLITGTGASSVSLDIASFGTAMTSSSTSSTAQLDALARAADAGVGLWLGVVAGTDTALDRGALVSKLRRLWDVLGLDPARLAEQVVPSTSCGLAGASAGYVRRAFSTLRDIGQELCELA